MSGTSRVIRSKTKARENYNRLSRWYDPLAGSSEAKFRQMGVRLLDLQRGENVLEIGFGTGHCLLAFTRSVGTDGMICGIDLSDGMAAVTRQRLIEAGEVKRVSLSLADGSQLPFIPGFFDAVYMSFTLELFDTPEIPKVLGECRRILKHNGRLVAVSLVKTTQPKLAERIYEWFHNQMPVLVDCRPIEMQYFLEESGFSIDTLIADRMWGLPVEIVKGNKIL